MKPYRAKLHLLLHSATLVEERVRDQLASLDILPRQARVIDGLNRLGQVSQAELADMFGISAASMSTMINRLLTAGLVSREEDPTTRRKNVIKLTQKGQDKLEGIYAAWQAVDDKIETIMGLDGMNVLFEQTSTLREGLGGKTPGEKDKSL